MAIVGSGSGAATGPDAQRRRSIDGIEEISQVPWCREVLIFFGDANLSNAVERGQTLDDRLDEFLARRCACGDSDRSRQIIGELVGGVDSQHLRASALFGETGQRHRVRRVRRTNHDHGIAFGRNPDQGTLPVGRGKAEIAATRRPHFWPSLDGRVLNRGPVPVAQRGLGEQCGRAVDCWECLDLGNRLDSMDCFGGDGHRADRFFMSLVTNVDNLISLTGANLDLVVDLGDEWADRVHHVPAGIDGGLDDLWCGSMCRQHDGRACRNVGDVIDEDHPHVLESLNDEAIMNNLVIAVHGRFECSNHGGEGLDGHLHTSAKTSGRSEQNVIDGHVSNVRPAERSWRPSLDEMSVIHPDDTAMPRVVLVEPDSPAARAGLLVGDELRLISGEQPRDILEYRTLVDSDEISFLVERDGLTLDIDVEKTVAEPLGIEVQSAVFDEVRTCDNHCEFCFIYQLPPNLRKSLYLKDDDYRLSFLYGNYTTLTRFTESDLERVITEKLSPLNVSIHATNPRVREELLRNRRGASSLRWLSALLDAGTEIHGQVVVCPSINDGDVLDQTLADIYDKYSALETVAVVPLGVSKYSTEERMRAHTLDEARNVVEIVEGWQDIFTRALGRPMVQASDEYYLMAQRPFPSRESYGDVPMYEDGIGMARSFEAEFTGQVDTGIGTEAGFFAWVDAAPAEGYRAPRSCSPDLGAAGDGSAGGDGGAAGAGEGSLVMLRPRRTAPVGVLTGPLGAEVLQPLISQVDRTDVRVITVSNEFFGGNVGVAGLMVGTDLQRVLANEPVGHRYLLPDVCLNRGVFLDGLSPDDLPRAVEIIPTDGIALRKALELS